MGQAEAVLVREPARLRILKPWGIQDSGGAGVQRARTRLVPRQESRGHRNVTKGYDE